MIPTLALPAVDPVLNHALAAALGVLLLHGAWAKLRDAIVFRETLANYELLPASVLGLVASALPLAEAAAGLLLLALPTRSLGALLAAALVAGVTLGVVVALVRGRGGIDCGCGGSELEVPIGAGLVARNLVLLALALTAVAPAVPRAVVWLDYPSIAGATLFLLGAWTLANTLLAQQSRLLALRKTP